MRSCGQSEHKPAFRKVGPAPMLRSRLVCWRRLSKALGVWGCSTARGTGTWCDGVLEGHARCRHARPCQVPPARGGALSLSQPPRSSPSANGMLDSVGPRVRCVCVGCWNGK